MKIDRILDDNTLSFVLNVLDQSSYLVKLRMIVLADIEKDAKNCESLVLGNGFRETRKFLAIPMNKV